MPSRTTKQLARAIREEYTERGEPISYMEALRLARTRMLVESHTVSDGSSPRPTGSTRSPVYVVLGTTCDGLDTPLPWKATPGEALVCFGVPGAGKTVLAQTIAYEFPDRVLVITAHPAEWEATGNLTVIDAESADTAMTGPSLDGYGLVVYESQHQGTPPGGGLNSVSEHLLRMQRAHAFAVVIVAAHPKQDSVPHRCTVVQMGPTLGLLEAAGWGDMWENPYTSRRNYVPGQKTIGLGMIGRPGFVPTPIRVAPSAQVLEWTEARMRKMRGMA